MMTAALAAAVLLALVATHLMRLENVAPATGAAIWLANLSLRALTTVFAALYVIFFVRVSDVFGLLTHWCWHAVVPVVTAHLPVNGHSLGNAATVLPAFVVAASLLSVAFGLWRAGRLVAASVRRARLGRGPRESVIVEGPHVVVAAAGVARPQVVVSAGALTALDEQELAAGLDHERGHIARGHRFVLLAAELFRGVGRFLPGTRVAARELRFHLERDADRWAVGRPNDPLALASAICKASRHPLHSVSMTALSGGGAPRRVQQLLNGLGPARPPRPGLASLLAASMVALALSLGAVLPATTSAGVRLLAADSSVHSCPD